jgi:azurin
MTDNKYIYKLFLPLLVFFIVSVHCNDYKTNTSISVALKAMDGLKYDKVQFNVKPGSQVQLTLTNVSDMPHNLLITKPGERENVVKAALQLAQKGPETNYVPDINAVLWSIAVISPGQTGSVKFTAPQQEGIYPYVCTYPGHGFVMFGEMHVTRKEEITEVSKQRDTNTVNASPHPYPLTPPYFYHTFIDGAGPSAIAVHLPNDLSYCWDADACRLQMAWKGGFIDMSDIWKGHFDASAKVLGEVFYTDKTIFPFSFNEPATMPAVKHKGYRLVEKYPEFHYTINGTDVFELIRPKPDGFGLIRDFRIPDSKSVLWFYRNNNDESIEYTSSAGSFDKNKLKLSPAQSKKFTITMTSYYLAFKNKNE